MLARWSFFCLCLWTVSIISVSGYCFKDPIKFERTVSGRVRKYCEYKHPPVVKKDAGYVIMFPDSSVFTGDCLACTCTMAGLTCCGFGHQELNSVLPSDCIQLQDGCHGLQVKLHNNSLDCFTGKPISYDSLDLHPDNAFSLPSLVKPGSTKVINVNEAVLTKTEIPIKAPQRVKTIRPKQQTQPTIPPTITPTLPTISHKQSTPLKQQTPVIKQNEMNVHVHDHHHHDHKLKPTTVKHFGTIPKAPEANIKKTITSIPPPKKNDIPIFLPRINKQQQLPVPTPPRVDQIKLFPVHGFGNHAIGGMMPNSVPQNIFSPNIQQRRIDTRFQTFQRNFNLPWQRPIVSSFATVTPSTFIPMPYVEPVQDRKEDSGSSGSSFNDFLFRMMMFGAFA